jgi:hypothetical protein
MASDVQPLWSRLLEKQGLAAVLILYFVGLIPGTTSPLIRFFQDHEAQAAALREHDKTTVELLRTNRLICRGVWRSVPEVQDQCGQP